MTRLAPKRRRPAVGLTHVVNLNAFGAHRPYASGHSHDYVLLEGALNTVSGLNVLHLRPVFFRRVSTPGSTRY
jgi:hypothetical protein